MEKEVVALDANRLQDLLSLGEEKIRLLEANLGQQPSGEICTSLLQELHSIIRKAKVLAKLTPACPNTPGTDSHRSPTGSPRTETSGQAFKEYERREMSKKRKTLPKWSNKVRVGPGGGVEVPLDDGYSWRKYGQKDILGAKFPRGYFRCTHRNAQGCQATKQVQRSDTDSSLFEVIYRGEHTCFQKPKHPPSPAPPAQATTPTQNHQLDPEPQLLNFKNNLKIETQGLDDDHHHHQHSYYSFSFPSTPVGCLKPEENIFSSPSTVVDNHFMGNFSSSFVSPATSESNYFPVSPCAMSSPATTVLHQHTPDSDLNDIISGVTSASNSPLLQMDFMTNAADFDSFDSSYFFP